MFRQLGRFFGWFFERTHYRLERHSIGLAFAIIFAAGIGGFVEIAPLFTIDETVEDVARHAGLHAAGAGRARHLHPRGLLSLPQPDDPHAARRGRALRAVLAGGRVASTTTRCSGARSAPDPTWRGSATSIRTTGRWPLVDPRDAGAGIGDAGLRLPAAHPLEVAEPAGAAARRCAPSACPTPTR